MFEKNLGEKKILSLTPDKQQRWLLILEELKKDKERNNLIEWLDSLSMPLLSTIINNSSELPVKDLIELLDLAYTIWQENKSNISETIIRYPQTQEENKKIVQQIIRDRLNGQSVYYQLIRFLVFSASTEWSLKESQRLYYEENQRRFQQPS